MSHTTTCTLKVDKEHILLRAIKKLGLSIVEGTSHTMFDRTVAEGVAVKLPHWQQPVVFNLKHGRVYYDNYKGHWGDQVELDKLVQQYTLEASLEQAAMAAYATEVVTADNGDITLYCDVD